MSQIEEIKKVAKVSNTCLRAVRPRYDVAAEWFSAVTIPHNRDAGTFDGSLCLNPLPKEILHAEVTGRLVNA
ncbi:hypothetical protein J6590_053215 [Homalodisca vitripennis]|nr:hypothetical protein J6590_053215 [Homalodisca vitripennis]